MLSPENDQLKEINQLIDGKEKEQRHDGVR